MSSGSITLKLTQWQTRQMMYRETVFYSGKEMNLKLTAFLWLPDPQKQNEDGKKILSTKYFTPIGDSSFSDQPKSVDTEQSGPSRMVSTL